MYTMDQTSENKIEQADGDMTDIAASPSSEQNTSPADTPPSCAKKKRLPLIKSMYVRTAVDYCLFSLILLLLFFVVFFSFIYAFYGRMTEGETVKIEQMASEGFPRRVDDNSLVMLYKIRLANIARSNRPVALAVFERDDNGAYSICIGVDDMGNGSVENNDLFDSVTQNLDFDRLFVQDKTSKVSTDIGNFLCKGKAHTTDDGKTVYLLVMKPYDVWNNQTMLIVNFMVLCTFVVLILAGVFSVIASRHQTKHLTDFSQKAKRLANGDYDLEFSGYGYNEYENLASALNAATRNMQNAEKLQRDIIANVSHDMRTPLTMIRAYAEMLRDMPMSDEKREKTANVIIAESDRLNALVGDVLDYSRMQSGVVEYRPAPCDLSDVASSVLERFKPACERDGIDMIGDIEDGAVVTCDRPKIEQVLYNLLGNAVNYCGDDKTVLLSVKKQSDRVRVEVTDHGSGIDPADIDSVWDRYYRSPHSTRTAVGSGLGLSICKSVLTAHNAEFGVISEIGKGSTFWFELK